MRKIPFHLVFILIISVMLVMNVLKPEDSFSVRENRTLQTAPSFTISSFQNKSYQAAVEQAYNDQFYLRDGFIKVQRNVITRLGMKQIGQVMIRNNQLYQAQEPIDPEFVDALTTQLNEFASSYHKLHFDFLLIPTKDIIDHDPILSTLTLEKRNYMNSVLSNLSSQYDIVNTMTPLIEHRDEYIYYKGDHHWTTLGAYTIFDEWRKAHQFNLKQVYTSKIANDAFYGTLSNQSGVEIRDQIELYIPQSDEIKTVVTYVEEQKKTTSVYDYNKQYSANPYEVFLGGNYPRIDIDTNAKETRRLLLIKDSYANCMIPFLLPYYHTITVIDPRYYYDSLASIISERSISDVMLLYNTNTFFSDSSLYHLLQEEPK